jgi:hypothetical protein
MSIKLKGGSLKLRGGSLKTFIPDPNTLTFSYDNNEWIFNASLVGQALADFNAGYEAQIQLVRYQPVASINTKTLNGRLLPNRSGTPRKVWGSYPNFIGINPNTGVLIPADKKARVNITSQSTSNFQNMNLTTWVNNMIKYEGIERHTNFKWYKLIRLNVLEGDGIWYSQFRFIILINNKRYALTNKFLKINYYNAGNISSTNISGVTQTSSLISINIS